MSAVTASSSPSVALPNEPSLSKGSDHAGMSVPGTRLQSPESELADRPQSCAALWWSPTPQQAPQACSPATPWTCACQPTVSAFRSAVSLRMPAESIAYAWPSETTPCFPFTPLDETACPPTPCNAESKSFTCDAAGRG